MKNIHAHTRTLILANFIFASFIVHAETKNSREISREEKIAILPSVTIEASRLNRDAAHIATTIETFSRKNLANHQSRNVVELLSRTSTSLNILQTGAGNPALAQVASAGYGENGFGRFAVMIDGQRINGADMAAPLLSQLNLGSLERIEILHGSQNVLHGDGASAGALNFVSEPASDECGGRLIAQFGSWNTMRAHAAFHGGAAADGLKWWSAGGWERSDGFRENNWYKLWNASGGISKEWANGTRLRLSSFWNHTHYGLPGYVRARDWKHNRREASSPDDWYRRQTVALSGMLDAVLADEVRAKIDFSLSSARMRSRNFYQDPFYTYDFRMLNDVYALEITPQIILTDDLFSFENEFLVGLFYREDCLRGENTDAPPYAYTRHSFAIFAQETFHINEIFAIEAGARFQHAMNQNNTLTYPRRSTSMTAADLALLATPCDTLKTYVRASRFFRSPFLDENPYKNWVAHELLKPETGVGVTMGGAWQVTDELNLFSECAFSRTKNEILYDQFFSGTNINFEDDVSRKTFSVGSNWTREKFASAHLSATLTQAEFEGGACDGKTVPLCPRATLLANGRFWLCDEFSILGGWRFLSSQNAISDFANEGARVASCHVFHVGARYEPKFANLDGFFISFAIDNLFDRRYADFAVRGSSGDTVFYPAAGRNYTLSIGYEF